MQLCLPGVELACSLERHHVRLASFSCGRSLEGVAELTQLSGPLWSATPHSSSCFGGHLRIQRPFLPGDTNRSPISANQWLL